jgi:cation-transporting P-type ATPase E
MVGALQQRGHVVAMTGDGVNDVLALKDSDIGIAMGSGSPASRAVAQLVLLDNEFAHLPVAVAEGRRVINNIERVAGLFVTKTVYSMLIALGVGVASLQFPFLPRHITLVGTLSIGVPGFFLALLPNNRRASSGFVRRVLRFAIPSGAIAAIATFTAYALAELEDGVSLTEARTTATLTLVAMGLIVLGRLARPLTPFKRILIAAMGSVFLLVTSVPSLRRFYDLDIPPRIVVFAAIGLVGLAAHALELTSRFSEWTQHRRKVPEQPDETD